MVGPQWVFMVLARAGDFVSKHAANTNCTKDDLIAASQRMLGCKDMTWAYSETDKTPGGLTAPQLKAQYYDPITGSNPAPGAQVHSDYSAFHYDAIYIWANAIRSYMTAENDPTFLTTWDHRKADQAVSEKIWQTILKTDMNGASGRIGFEKNGDRKGGAEIHQLRGSTWELRGSCQAGACAFTAPVDFGLIKPFDPAQTTSWTDGSLPRGAPKICTEGSTALGEVCTPCPVNTYHDIQLGSCRKCKAGRFQPREGQIACDGCPPGQYTNENIMTCRKCDAGSYVNEVGSSKCISCPAGTFAGTTGESACKLCPLGRYSNESASTECFYCGKGAHTKADDADLWTTMRQLEQDTRMHWLRLVF